MSIPANDYLQEGQIGQTSFPLSSVPGDVATDTSNLSAGKYLLGLVINKVMSLLIKMVETLQQVASQQASRLTFLTAWQGAYVSQMNSVHTFAGNNGDAYVGAINDENTTTRQDLNAVNSSYTEQARSNSTLISDAAKGLQTNINQTQDAVNQQVNLCSSIQQRLQSLLTAIYK